jgi:hypothetical protein
VQTTLSKLWLFVLSERTVDPEFFVLGPVVRLLDTKRPLAPEEPEDTSRATTSPFSHENGVRWRGAAEAFRP